MNIRQVFLYCALAIVGMFLWKAWVAEHSSADKARTELQAQQENKQTSAHYTPPSYQAHVDATKNKPSGNNISTSNVNNIRSANVNASTSNLTFVTTDVLKIGFSKYGGDVVFLQLLKYPTSLKEKDKPLLLMSSDQNNLYVNQSGLTGVDDQSIIFTPTEKAYSLSAGEKNLSVVLTGRSKEGLLITKTYQFERDKYLFRLNESVKNNSSRPFNGSFYFQIQRKKVAGNKKSGVFRGHVYEGASISSSEKRYKKVTYKDMDSSNLSQNIQDGWIAMQQRYFVNALIPQENQMMHYYSRQYQNDVYTIGVVSSEVTIAPSKTASFQIKSYIGPKIDSRLKAAAKGLDLTINYGWLWIISDAIFWLMSKINLLVGNWGWTIVLITILIKILFYPLSAASFRSMGRMHQMQPRIQALKERFGDDKKALSQATMELYRKEKINPLGGCLPMLIQIPVFIALYYVLIESVQLRQAPFIFWIHDLSAKDPYYILPILMGGSMFLTQKLSSVSIDPNQAKMMMVLPVVFTVLFASFPSGLVLYWLVNNCVQGLQQWYVMRKIQKSPKKK
jgi:YidC/Oxa1 family membrane protein insertase